MRTAIWSLALLALASACYSYDGDGKTYPPDVTCDDLQGCFDLASVRDKVVQCYGAMPDSPEDPDAYLWGCFEDTGCLHTDDDDGYAVTTQATFGAFLATCFSEKVGADHPFDAAWDDTFWADLKACLTGAKATQDLLIDVCYTE